MNLAATCLAACGLVLAGPAVAVAEPSLRASPSAGEVGDDVTLHGRGWVVGGGCSNRIVLSFRQGSRRMRLGQALHGDGAFAFHTHYQRAEPGPARFVARQTCADRVYSRYAPVTVGPRYEAVPYRGQTEHGGRVSFVVVDGNEVRRFRFMNRCSTDRRFGSRVPGAMPIGDVSFSRRGREFTIFGRFGARGGVSGTARQRNDGCDSGRMRWMARRVS